MQELRKAFEHRMNLAGITDLSDERFAAFIERAKRCDTYPQDVPCPGCPDCMANPNPGI